MRGELVQTSISCWAGEDRSGEIIENAGLRAAAFWIVSYVDTPGIRHAVEVEALSLYEAAILAIRAFRQRDCEPGQASSLEVEVQSTVVHHYHKEDS